MASSNRKQVEALSEIGDIIVKLSDKDLERLESLGEQITPFDPELADRILDASTLLTQLNDDVELALERLESDTEDEDIQAAEAEVHATGMEDEEDAGKEPGKARSKRKR